MTDPIQSHILRDGETSITVLSMGCAVQDWRVAGRRVVLGRSDPEDYRTNPGYLGAVVGRVANRIGGARFSMGHETWELVPNDGPHQLHGGPEGFGTRNWRMTPEGDRSVLLELTSEDGDMGYPGRVEVAVRMRLEGHALTWEMTATPDRETPVALAQHTYFNIAGEGDVRDHVVRVAADHVTPTGPDLIPTGELLEVTGTRYDFRSARTVADADPEGEGYDLNYALSGPASEPQAEVRAAGMRLRLWTDQPGLQVYTSMMLTTEGSPFAGVAHGPFAAFCLEAQGFPNAVNTPAFPPVLCAPERPYRQVTTVEIAPDT
ncbi:aldose epimerase family protein [Sagittula salina]|uniref:Galactose mutarotase n=1 Tax=Sagittula salina TaxID=2820268 RepID=A0A940MQQ9_9RHOB|nr:aldose epimerase family protein [Sagittula salina]MBP0483247.1 galactose mutarotase [Sagittula salina]